MITHIRMKNFKSWLDSGEVKLAPLTGFFGTNSSGKSSLLQMLLLLKQTVGEILLKQTVGEKEVLFFGNENSLVNLGNFREMIHGHKDEELLELEFGCTLQNPFTLVIPRYNNYGYSTTLSLAIDSFTFNTAIQGADNTPSIKYSSYEVGPDEDLKMKWENRHINIGNQVETAAVSLNNFYRFSGGSRDALLRHLASSFEKVFAHVYYLGPTRVHPQRHYHWEGKHPKEVDLWGNKAIDALLSARMRQLKTSNKETGVSIEEKISQWLRKMELADSFWLGTSGSLDDNNYEVRIRKNPNSAEVTLADMGHGLADLLPLLVHCYYVPEGSTLILEQPGVHLHPLAQAQLADLFLDVIAERNLQILVESHSEHLLTRLQRRIAEKQVTKDQVALYFCRNNDGASTIEELDVTESGEIKNWPENFFGDVIGDMFAVTDAQMEPIADQKEASN